MTSLGRLVGSCGRVFSVFVSFFLALRSVLGAEDGDDDHHEEDDGDYEVRNPGLRFVSLSEGDTLEKERDCVAGGDSHCHDGNPFDDALEDRVRLVSKGASLFESRLALGLVVRHRQDLRRGSRAFVRRELVAQVVQSGKPGGLSCVLQLLVLVRESLDGNLQSALDCELRGGAVFDFCAVVLERLTVTRLSRVGKGVESLTQVVFIENGHVSTPILSMGFLRGCALNAFP